MLKNLRNAVFTLEFWRLLAAYLPLNGIRKATKATDLNTPATLAAFLHSRASHVAQTSLYGYMKTRAGTSFPMLFEHPDILASINIAKWHIYLACLSDLAVYTGILLRTRSDASVTHIREILSPIVANIVAINGTPADAGDDYQSGVQKLNHRLNNADFSQSPDDGSAFVASPAALVYWSPIADQLKNRDIIIVRNSISFRWHEVRRDLRRRLQVEWIVKTAIENTAQCN